MSDSVGKISLDLEVKSDLSKQINSMSNSIGNSFKNSISTGTKSMFSNMKTGTDIGIKNMNKSLKTSLGNTKNLIRNMIKSINSNSINIPIAKPNVTIPNSIKGAVQANKGPPVEQLTANISSTEKELDNVNNKIEFLNNKLSQLKESLRNAFSENSKMKIQDQILKTEGNIVSLTSKSDKLGFKLAELDSRLEQVGNESTKTSSKIGILKNKTDGAANSTKKLNNSTNSARNGLSSYNNGIVGSIKMMFKWMIILPLIVKGITAMATGLYNNLMTNEQFANSLAQIKTNLQVAFTPIFNYILPAINALMSALATATQYIASFISAIFGKTYSQSKQATQGLIDAKQAMGAYGDSAKKAGKDVKDALGLAGIDEINSLGSNESDGDSGGSGGGGGIPTLVEPDINTSIVDSKMKGLIDRIKKYFSNVDFKPFADTINILKNSIKWLIDEALVPLAKWTVSDFLPAFLNLLSGALTIINPILEVSINLFKWLWDSFLQPIAMWTGGVIVDVLNGLADVLRKIGDWVSENTILVESFIIVIGSFAAAWGLVTLAMKAWNIVVGIWSSIGTIATVVTSAFGAAVAFLTSPIGIAILIIGALIAIGILLYKNWDVIKVKAGELWSDVKSKFEVFKNWLGNAFVTDWSKKFGSLGDIMNGFFKNIRDIFDGIKQLFRGIIDFVTGVFTGNWSRAWQGVKDIFFGIMNTLGSVMKAPLNGIIGLVNAAISGLNKLSVKIPSWVPGVGGSNFGVNLPKIPYLAKGGVLDSPTLAMVGEAGKEAVVPLENNTGGLDLLASKLLERMPSRGGSDDNYNGDLTLMIDGSVIGKVALKQLKKMQRQGGITLIPT